MPLPSAKWAGLAAVAVLIAAIPTIATAQTRVGIVHRTDAALVAVYFTGEQPHGFDLFIFPKTPPRGELPGAHYRVGILSDCHDRVLEPRGPFRLVDVHDGIISSDVPLDEALAGLGWPSVRAAIDAYACERRMIRVFPMSDGEGVSDLGAEFQKGVLD